MKRARSTALIRLVATVPILAAFAADCRAQFADTYSVAVATVAYDGTFEAGNFLGYQVLAYDDASDGTGPVVGVEAILLGPTGDPLFQSLVTLDSWGDQGFEATATLTAISGPLFGSIPESALWIAGDGGPWAANAFNYTVGNILGVGSLQRDGIDIATEWLFIEGEVALVGGTSPWSIEYVQEFHPSDIPGAPLTDVHLGFSLDLGLLQANGATSMTITARVLAIPAPGGVALLLALRPGRRRRS